MSDSDKVCADWYKVSLRQFINIFMVFLLIFSPLTVFFVISDNIRLRINCDLTDFTLSTYSNLEVEQGVFASDSNSTLIPFRLDVYLIPSEFSEVVENDRVLTQFVSGTFATNFEEGTNLYLKMVEGERSFQVISTPITADSINNIEIKVSLNYRIMFCLVYIVDFTSIDESIYHTVNFFSISNDLVNTEPPKYRVLIQPYKLLNININVKNATIASSHDVKDFYNYLYGRQILIYYENINNYPFRLGYDIALSLF